MERASSRRLTLVTAAVVCAACGIGARLFYLQIVIGEDLGEKARGQHIKIEKVLPPRGTVYDRHGVPLAMTVHRWSLWARPGRLDETGQRELASRLAPLIGWTEADVLERLHAADHKVYIARTLPNETAQRLRSAGVLDPAIVDLEQEPARVYPHGDSAGHLLGFANVDGIGLEGVEHAVDEALAGDPQEYVVVRDARQEEISRHPRGRPERLPQDVVLTIDLALQRVVERELAAAVRRTGALSASAVMLDPVSGDVLALANVPEVDPNHFGRDANARSNRAVEWRFEPGSTFKLVPMAAALERDRVRTNEWFDCQGGRMRRGRRVIQDVSRNGRLTAAQVFAKSSNVGMAKITERLTHEELSETIRAFGFGHATGIEQTAESSGFVYALDGWKRTSRDSLAQGYELEVTALQMASLYATVANDGIRVPPRLAHAVIDAQGRRRALPRPGARRVISTRTAADLQAMMELVVTAGTGKAAAVDGYRVAGKSGTAKIAGTGGYVPGRYRASFGGFAPADRPRLALYVVLHEPQGRRIHGGDVAAPAFRAILREALPLLGAPRDDPDPPSLTADGSWVDRLPPADPIPATRENHRMPDVRGLSARAALRLLSEHGVAAQLDGGGYVARQTPEPGAPVDPGAACRLQLRPAGALP